MFFSNYAHVGILFALSIPLVWAFALCVLRPADLIAAGDPSGKIRKSPFNTLFLRLMLSLSFGTVGLSFYLSYSVTVIDYEALLFIWTVGLLSLIASFLYRPVFFHLTEKLQKKPGAIAFLSAWLILALILIPLSLTGFYTVTTEMGFSLFQISLSVGIGVISVLSALISRSFFKEVLPSEDLRNNNRFLRCSPEVIKEALQNDHLEFLYQPVFNPSWQIEAFGIKIYRHTRLGPISENEFIKSLEKTELIPEIIRYILGKNCQAASFWPEHLSLYLRIPYLALSHETFLPSLEEICEKSRFSPGRLILEISYDAFALLPEGLFIRLKELGVLLMLGQFRGEQEEIRLLEKFRPWGVKLAPYLLFTLRSGQRYHQERIPKALTVLRLAKEKDLKVFAGNIVGLRTLKLLKENGCNYFAGPIFKAPVPEEGVLPLLRHHNFKEPGELRPVNTTTGRSQINLSGEDHK